VLAGMVKSAAPMRLSDSISLWRIYNASRGQDTRSAPIFLDTAYCTTCKCEDIALFCSNKANGFIRRIHSGRTEVSQSIEEMLTLIGTKCRFIPYRNLSTCMPPILGAATLVSYACQRLLRPCALALFWCIAREILTSRR
jgi:hypothetical protein